MKRICKFPLNSAGMNSKHSHVCDNKRLFNLFIILALTLSIILCFPSFASAENDTDTRTLLYPGGMPFGVRMKTKGVMIVGMTDFKTSGGIKSPGEDSGLKAGDIIEKISGYEISSADEISEIVKNSGGEDLLFEIKRQGKVIAVRIKPEISSDDATYRVGLFLKDSAAGIGTLTFISQDKMTFAGLGHGICSIESREPMPFLEGNVYDVIITGVVKGRKGAPGELHGKLSNLPNGKLSGNLFCGVFGRFDSELALPENGLMEAATEKEIKEGDAYILTSVNSDRVQKYRVNISHLELNGKEDKNFTITICDDRLISTTGGIVQGMSGSPIIQNGRIIGALTHVLVDDPLCGYGIWIGNMLNNMPSDK